MYFHTLIFISKYDSCFLNAGNAHAHAHRKECPEDLCTPLILPLFLQKPDQSPSEDRKFSQRVGGEIYTSRYLHFQESSFISGVVVKTVYLSIQGAGFDPKTHSTDYAWKMNLLWEEMLFIGNQMEDQ